MGDITETKVIPIPEENMLPSLAPIPKEIARGLNYVCKNSVKLNNAHKNEYHNYNFASIDDFLEVYGSIIAEAGLTIIMDEVEEKQNDKVLKIVYHFIFIHESGAMWQHPIKRSIRVNSSAGSQAYGQAQSYCLKQFLRGVFMIPTGESKHMKAEVETDLDYSKQEKLNMNKAKFDNANGSGNVLKPKFHVDVVKDIEDELSKCKSDGDIDNVFNKNKETINGLSDRNKKTLEASFKAMRSTVL